MLHDVIFAAVGFAVGVACPGVINKIRAYIKSKESAVVTSVTSKL